MERNNAITQEKIATREKNIAQANYLLSAAKTISETDPTEGLRIAEAAMLKHNDPAIEAAAYKLYRENSFYKIIARQPREISAVTTSSDGNHILSVSKDSSARIWDMKGNMIRVFKDHSQLVCAAYSPDGKFIATGSRQGDTRLWNINGTLLTEIKGSSYITAVAFSPDGKYILTGSVDSTAKLWSLQGKLVREFTGHKTRLHR